jgi:hypothetical protein
MPARATAATAEAPVGEVEAASPAAGHVALQSLSAPGLLALQRSIGNAAVGRLLQRRVTMTTEGDVPAAPVTGIGSWTEAEVRTIQRELARLNLYNLSVDGDPGARTEVSLSEAFGNDSWRTMTATEVTEALRAAEKPWAGKGRTLRYAELFRDGVLDVTFGVGYFESQVKENNAAETRMVADAVVDAIKERGYKEDTKKAAELLAAAGRPLADSATGRFFVKENAFTYSPPAGESRAIHSIVRVVSNEVAGGGASAAAAFREGMAAGDAAWYSGHGRYGTGPDFDRNFIEFRLRSAAGTLEQTIDSYEALEHELAKGGKDPWKVFQQRLADGTLEVDLSNAGNVRIADHAHSSEFGAKLINWALAKTGTKLQTGSQGQLAEDAAKSPQRYRVLAFYGCSTNSYDKEFRATEGFNTKQADILVTNRTTRGGADVAAFMSFLDGLVSQTSAEKMLSGVNKAMRQHEHQYAGDPWQFTGTRDNPGK